jgi:flavin reductase (DIM6/NTAB) family NADH-FMN oxidoreductase RutF
MLEEASLNLECRLFNEIIFGYYMMLIGEVFKATDNTGKQSLIYHNGNTGLYMM